MKTNVLCIFGALCTAFLVGCGSVEFRPMKVEVATPHINMPTNENASEMAKRIVNDHFISLTECPSMNCNVHRYISCEVTNLADKGFTASYHYPRAYDDGIQPQMSKYRIWAVPDHGIANNGAPFGKWEPVNYGPNGYVWVDYGARIINAANVGWEIGGRCLGDGSVNPLK